MGKIKNLHNVSAIYFFIFAFLYVAMVLFLRNGLWADFFLSLMKILDIPFAFVSLIYGGTTLALQLKLEKDDDGSLSPWVLIIFVACLLLFSGLVFINFAFPSQL